MTPMSSPPNDHRRRRRYQIHRDNHPNQPTNGRILRAGTREGEDTEVIDEEEHKATGRLKRRLRLGMLHMSEEGHSEAS